MLVRPQAVHGKALLLLVPGSRTSDDLAYGCRNVGLAEGVCGAWLCLICVVAQRHAVCCIAGCVQPQQAGAQSAWHTRHGLEKVARDFLHKFVV